MPVVAILMESTCACSGAMALTPSTMLPLGTDLPDFQLPTISGTSLKCSDLDQKPVLLMVICAHCPFVKHIEPELTRLDQDYRGRIQLLAVSSNSLITHPQDGAAQLMDQAERHSWSFPYLMDQDQTLARSLRAACTPEFYLFAGSHESSRQTLQYRGQLDGSRPGNAQPLDGSDLRNALNAVLSGEPVNPDQIPSIGCNVKWHPGLEPDWFG